MTSMIKNTLTTAAFFASFITGTSAWAHEATLALNERAAQNTIVETAQSRPILNDKSVATLAHNEDAAQRVIVDATASIPARAGVALDEATLSRNEIAAQRAIADAPASKTVATRRISASFGAASAALR